MEFITCTGQTSLAACVRSRRRFFATSFWHFCDVHRCWLCDHFRGMSGSDVGHRELTDSRRLKCRFISDRRAWWSLSKRQQNRSQCRGGLVGPRLLVDRELRIRKPRQPLFHAENAKSGDNRAPWKRRDRETSQGCGTDTRKTGARVDDLPDRFTFAKRSERCVARNV